MGQKCKEYIFFFSENKESLSKQVRTAILELEYLAKWLIEFGNSQHGTYEGIGFSEKLRIPSLVSTDYLPGRKIRQYLTGNKLPKCKILLTSATISDTNSNIGEDSFTDIRVELGIKQNEIYQRKKFFPSDFGSMSFVLPDKNIPNPVLKNETGNIDKVSFDPQWLKYISSMILEAGKNRRGVLVLTHSFSETEAIRSQIIETKNIYFHLHDTQIKDCIDALKEQSGILISPGLSEGFSERKPEGAQLFGDLVITRIPFNPFSEFHQDVFVEQYLKNVIGSNMNMAKRSFYAKSQGYALRKFRQQLGRGLRKYDDSITIWVGDPRFPHPSAINNYSLNEYNSIFRRVIPTRFYNEYQNSLVFGEDGRFNKAILEENMENIVL